MRRHSMAVEEALREAADEFIDWCDRRNLKRGEERCGSCSPCTAYYEMSNMVWDGRVGEWVRR